MNKFPARIPRKMFWSSDVDGTSTCPECRSRLERDHHTYVVAVWEDQDTFYMISSDDGYFCPQCPTVVLDYDEFVQYATMSAEGSQFTVAGLVDFDAVPEEMSAEPLGTDENPIPLVEFTNLRSVPQERPRRKPVKKRKSVKKPKPVKKGKRRSRRKRKRK